MTEPRSILQAARSRLEWLRVEYGADDIDYLTFKPVVDVMERLTCPYCAPDEPCALHQREECPMCGWTLGTNPESCGECARWRDLRM